MKEIRMYNKLRRINSHIATYDNKIFDFIHTHKNKPSIKSIAKGLSNTCRFGGQCDKFYSVAEHSVLISHIVTNPNYKFTALMHDSAEAFLGDIPTPLKNLLNDYKVIEKEVEAFLAEQYDFINPIPLDVKVADIAMLHTELIQVMNYKDINKDQLKQIPPAKIKINFWDPKKSYEEFLNRFWELNEQ